MTISEKDKERIKEEYNTWMEGQYAGKDLKERQKMAQFFTPPELSIRMLEKFDDNEGTILDPTIGAGGLIAAAILAGFDPKKCYGIELDKKILDEVCRPRLEALGVPMENLHQGNALNPECYEFKDDYEFVDDGKLGIVKFKNTKFKFGGMREDAV